MNNLKILEWNIHQQGRKSKIIPMDIIKYIIGEDIIILLEINTKSTNFNEFREALTQKGYKLYMACYWECDYANDILIAVNSTNNIDIRVKRVSYYTAYSSRAENNNDGYFPENIFLDTEINNMHYVIAGVRIKELNSNYQMRKKQMETLIDWTNEIKVPIILLGDFNNLRENTPENRWNIRVLDNKIKGKFIRKTPKSSHSWGVSYYPCEEKYDGYIKEDHLLLSASIRETDKVGLRYCWDYLDDNIDRCVVKDINSFGQKQINVPIGFPDHAIFKVRIPLDILR